MKEAVFIGGILLVVFSFVLWALNEHKAGNFDKEEIIYIKDSRTGLCFAYLWQGSLEGGPGLACVPCEKVEHLIKD